MGQENAAWMYENNLGSTAISQIKATPYAASNEKEGKGNPLILLTEDQLRLQQEKMANYSQLIQNERKAFYFYQLAAGQLSSKAYLKLGNRLLLFNQFLLPIFFLNQQGDFLYYGKAGLEVNYASAAACYSMASNLKNGQAAFNLGAMHHLGVGLTKDLHLAKRQLPLSYFIFCYFVSFD